MGGNLVDHDSDAWLEVSHKLGNIQDVFRLTRLVVQGFLQQVIALLITQLTLYPMELLAYKHTASLYLGCHVVKGNPAQSKDPDDQQSYGGLQDGGVATPSDQAIMPLKAFYNVGEVLTKTRYSSKEHPR